MSFAKAPWKGQPDGGSSSGMVSVGNPYVGTSYGTSGFTSTAPSGKTENPNVLELPQGLICYHFGYSGLAASLTDAIAYMHMGGAVFAAGQSGVLTPFRGSVVAIGARTANNVTSGALTIETSVGGDLSITSQSGSSGVATFQAGEYPFDALTFLFPLITTDGSFGGGTHVGIQLYVVQQQSEIL